MTVTVYLEGPTKASRRLSPLTARALGPGQASWHTTLAASIMGAGQLGGEGMPRADTNQLRGLGVRMPRHPGSQGQLGFSWARRDPQVATWLAQLQWPREGQTPFGGLALCWPGAQAVHLLLGWGRHRPSLIFRFEELVCPKTTLARGV